MSSRRLYRRSLTSRHRDEPSIHVVVRLEHDPRVHIVAGSEGDARRLALWLQSSDVLDVIPAALEATVDALRSALDDEDIPT